MTETKKIQLPWRHTGPCVHIMIPKYIDSDDCETAKNDPGFLIESCCSGKPSRWLLQIRPQYTNGSNKPQLNGWCGETNNVSRYARGLARVIAHSSNGRALIEAVPTNEIAKALDFLAYPELAEEQND